MDRIKLTRLATHARNDAPRPAMKDVLRHVETSTNPNHHWEWDANAEDRLFNRYGQAIWRLKTVAWLPRLTFVVARLLLDGFRGPVLPGTSFTSRCGIQGCVCPDHWERVLAAPRVRLQPRLNGWVAIVSRTGNLVTMNTSLVVKIDGDTHVISAGPDLVTSYRTTCGLMVYPTSLVVYPSNTVVTCAKGCT